MITNSKSKTNKPKKYGKNIVIVHVKLLFSLLKTSHIASYYRYIVLLQGCFGHYYIDGVIGFCYISDAQ